MRAFVLYARKAKTDSNFNLEDLPGSGGKMDTVSRFVTSSLWTSHSIRRDVVVYTVLNGPPNGPITIEWSGETIRRVDPNERNIAIWIKKALDLINSSESKEWERLQEGIRVSRKSFQEIIRELDKFSIYVLEERGEAMESVEIGKNSAFAIGDSIGLSKNEEKFVLRYGKKISLGKKAYFASTCCSIVNYILDKRFNT